MEKLRKWRVLALERHFKITVFTHTFTRLCGWSSAVGLHYRGGMDEGNHREMGRPRGGRRICDRHQQDG